MLLVNRLRTLCLMLLVSPAWLQAAPDEAVEQEAQQVIQPKIERRKIDIDQIDTENFEVGVFTGMLSVEDFGVNSVVGARIAYHVTEGVFFEAAYAKADTSPSSYERLSGGAKPLTSDERKLTYYNISLGYNLLPGEVFLGDGWVFNSAAYVIGGVGNTKFAGANSFTMNFGFGYRFLATDWLALHVDVRDHIFDVIDVLGEKKTTHNLEVQGGLTVFF
ncbi:MAG: outer membrane beta-barrel domain-containing protein [Gammaproteobacteria bacterium]|nr:outer membrane beta-barrel domain-containing protein [Gammaproteobacteria bacterium]